MKKILFNKITDHLKNFRRISLSQTAEESEYISTVTKSFSYKVSLTDKLSPEVARPDVQMTKEFDTKKKIERFHFRVKGYFFTVHDRIVAKVHFEHDLRIEIQWKTSFSPKKSVVLTE